MLGVFFLLLAMGVGAHPVGVGDSTCGPAYRLDRWPATGGCGRVWPYAIVAAGCAVAGGVALAWSTWRR